MKILIVGAWKWSQYEEAFGIGLRAAGVDVIKLSTGPFFKGAIGRYQQAIPFPSWNLFKLNDYIIRIVGEVMPDYALFWRPIHILPQTIDAINRIHIKTISYNNDDPFGPSAHGDVPWHHRFLWHWYIKSLPHYSLNYFYRNINCIEAVKLGAVHADVMMPYFLPWKDRPLNIGESDILKYCADVVFAGHYEPDGRERRLQALHNSGLSLKLWGGDYWTREVLGSLYDSLSPIIPAVGDDYAKAISGGKVCLGFLSKINRDTYTRRCFEIPACGSVLLAERTDDLQSLLKENVEACYYESDNELIEKSKWLTKNENSRCKIALAGQRRVWSDGHDVYSRAIWFIRDILNVKD